MVRDPGPGRSCDERVSWMRDQLGLDAASTLAIIETDLAVATEAEALGDSGQVLNVQRNFPYVLDGRSLGVAGPEAGPMLANGVEAGTLFIAAHHAELVRPVL